MTLEELAIGRPGKLNWTTAFFMGMFHVGAVVALFFFSWKALALLIFLNWVSGSLGIGMGYHRLLTHRSYRVPKGIEYFLTTCATLALEGGPIFWVGVHRIHHARSDKEGDPHTPHDGRWWSHMGWILGGVSSHRDTAKLARFTPDLAADPYHRWISRWHFLPMIALAAALYALGGLPFVLWGIFLRVVVGLHSTWLVNSATHLWGKRRYVTTDDSRNNWWVALLSFGEGWHNNHHAHPTSAQHGLAWYEIDMNWWGIRTLQLLRLAKNVKLAKLAEPVLPEAEDWVSASFPDPSANATSD
jgi:stearoyl-CoA desaturase (delta-9 desaturase)